MKSIVLLTFLLSFHILNADETNKETLKVGDWDGAFHQQLHDKSKHCYLVAIYSETRGLMGGKMPQIIYKATVVQKISGEKNISDKIIFDRVYDMDISKKTTIEGQLYYVFYSEAPMNGSPKQHDRYIDAQDPTAMFQYNKKREAIAEAHKKTQ
jgi:hypothetical protein